MSTAYTPPSLGETELRPPTLAEAHIHRAMSRLMRPLEATAASLMTLIIVLLLVAVLSRYVFSQSIVWVDEVVSFAFIWLTMIGTAIAMHRNEHLRLTLVVELLPPRARDFVNAFALAAVAAFLIGLMHPAYEYTREEWDITRPR
jgi:TRAP-type C4-dicarboxylate transport system permease small subunit